MGQIKGKPPGYKPRGGNANVAMDSPRQRTERDQRNAAKDEAKLQKRKAEFKAEKKKANGKLKDKK